MSSGSGNNAADGMDISSEEDPRQVEFKDRYRRSEARLIALLGSESKEKEISDNDGSVLNNPDNASSQDAQPASVPKKPARVIDEDDYGDDDDEDEEDNAYQATPSKVKQVAPSINVSTMSNSINVSTSNQKPNLHRSSSATSEVPKTSEDVRKKLEEDKKAAEDAARRSFNEVFYTLETDRDAMLEQQKLDELDRQVENEMSGSNTTNTTGANGTAQPGSLSTTALGGSISLTLKHLINRIDQKRDRVHASDAQLRSLMSEVRKNRSKWASESRIGQEELYESMEKVLMELKAMTEHAHPFLQKVNKREAPDYYQIIKHPMDIGTMLKKLKQLQYKSKKEFVDDLMLIWSNCLKYNADPAHYLRKKALYMKKETEKLVPLIPDIVVRDRAEVEAEERRLQNGDADGAEDSDDEEPIMASRGRKAPSKGAKGSNNARKAPPPVHEGTPGAETKPLVPSMLGASSNLKHEVSRAGSDAPGDGSINGFTTPPPGTLTPIGINGVLGSAAAGSQADISELDASGIHGMSLSQGEDADIEDLEYKTWKQITKKDRATIAAERHRLFRGDALNVDEPAILRSKAGMRRWMRHRKQALDFDKVENTSDNADGKDGVQTSTVETLAEGIEEDDDRQVPDYYDPVSAIPDIDESMKWVEDSENQIVVQQEDFLRRVPRGIFTSPESIFTKKMEANMRQMQETRKVCAKIGIVKQMQLQAQTYQNQFQKYDPRPFFEADVEPMVVSDDGPVISPWTCRAALQRSVGKIFYHAGFEEFQPAALDAVTDIAANFFTNLVRTMKIYGEAPKVRSGFANSSGDSLAWKPRFTQEEAILHSLYENGVELESLEYYVKDEVDRLNTKLLGMHERMKSHLAELLRPALDPSIGSDGVGAFNDGSEQFVGGDFAEDIDEDFFGFKELGLDIEFGLSSHSVPFHLLQNRMHNAYQANNANAATTDGIILEQPPAYDPVTVRNIGNQIGIIQDFFRKKLEANGNEPLLEDEDLPAKQRYPKPRLPPTGKISSPRKRPLKEQQQMARKKRKLEEGKDDSVAGNTTPVKGISKPVGKLRLDMPASKENIPDPEKDEGSAVGMMSPESIAA